MIGRPGATCTYATADWLSAVDREYKKADATVMSLIGLGGLGRQTNRPELIEDYSKPQFPKFHGPGPGPGPQFRSSTVFSFRSSTVPVPVHSFQFLNYVYETIGYILTGTKTDAYIQ